MDRKKTRLYVQLAIFFMAALFILIGVCRKETVEIINKAIWICMECIGIG